MSKAKFRLIEKMDKNGCWVEVKMKDVVKGDRFRLFEPDGGNPRGHKVAWQGAVVFCCH